MFDLSNGVDYFILLIYCVLYNIMENQKCKNNIKKEEGIDLLQLATTPCMVEVI